ncbi:membrane hypothetical protein [Mesorhizobium prunaredense]|uniref:Uncharacterized protein n=1 Tax=Mesorhizobium prunaredense TaxID=1631249 RepID=A0A1R3V205_9HYPH|nr:hypothetical protein [Mesorhizobium prunaredense]SIT53910.1 membrane hypothetical protein [Mesorhizobium prunaredense]
MSRGKAVGYAIGLPLSLLGLLFLPAGSIGWRAGWLFVAVVILAFGISALVLARVNPIIFRARSRFRPGTKRWDKVLLSVILPAMVAIIPVAALDAGRFHWSVVPPWGVALGYAALLAGIAKRNLQHGPGTQSKRHIYSHDARGLTEPGLVIQFAPAKIAILIELSPAWWTGISDQIAMPALRSPSTSRPS